MFSFNLIPKNKIILLCGYCCSGKTTAATMLIGKGYHHIKISDIVKNIANDPFYSRDGLNMNEISTETIKDDLIDTIETYLNKGDNVVVDGIRRPYYFKAIISRFNLSDVSPVWLEVPSIEGEIRFELRADNRDKGITYQDAVKMDIDMGIDEIKSFIKYNTYLHV